MSILLKEVTATAIVMVLFYGDYTFTEIIMIVYEVLGVHLFNYDTYCSI